MTADGEPDLRTCAFGGFADDGLPAAWAAVADGRGWGLIRAVGAGQAGDGADADAVPAIEGSGPDREWLLSAEGMEATLSPVSEPVSLSLPDYEPAGFSQVCRVTGRVTEGGVERQLECLGQRAERSMTPDLSRVDSVRELTAWVGPDSGLALIALRPRGAKGHDADAVSAVLFDCGEVIEIAEPRLSTAYTTAGVPVRASLELWLEGSPGDDSDDGDGDGGAHQFPRRLAGEAVAGPAELADAGQVLHAGLFRWHMSAPHGAGCYLLSRPAPR